MAEEEIKVALGATVGPLQSGMQQATGIVQQAVSQMSGSLGTLTSAFGGLQGKILEFTAAIASGALFREAISSTIEFEKSVYRLATTFGITTQQASAFAGAAEEVGISQETLTGAALKLDRQVKANESTINAWGLATRDANGHLLDQTTLMEKAIDRLKDFKQGTDRNEAALTFFGRGVGDVNQLLLLTPERVESVKTKMEALGLTIGTDNVEAMMQYKISMNDVDLVWKGIKKTIAEALMPVLQDLADWFASIGPQAVEATRIAMQSLIGVVRATGLGFEIVYDVLKRMGEALGTLAAAIVLAVERISHGDLKGAGKAFKDAWTDMSEQAGRSTDEIIADINRTNKAIEDMVNGAATKTKGKSLIPGKGTEHAPDMRAPDISEWVADMKLRLDAEKNNGEERVKIALEIANRVGQTYGMQSTQYKAALGELLKVTNEYRDQQIAENEASLNNAKDHAQRQLAIEKERIDYEEKMGIISASQKLIQLQQVEDAQYAIELKALQQRLLLYDEEPKKRAQVNAEISKLQDQHNLDMKKTQDGVTEEMKKKWEGILAPINSAFDTSIKGIIMGTTTLKQAEAKIGQSILDEFISLGLKKVTSWIATQIALTSATAAGEAARGSIEAGAASASLASEAALAIKKIWNYAAESFAGVTAFLAPMMGPFAPAGAAVVSGIVIAEAGNILSAEGGFDIPKGLNPMTQLHSGEMVLPSKIADKVRAMPDNGISASPINLTIHAIDAPGVKKLFMDHGPAMADSLRRQMRNFQGLTT